MKGKKFFLLFFVLSLSLTGKALVDFEGSVTIDKILLLRDFTDKNKYYYLPPCPGLSINADGKFDFSFINYVGNDDKSTGAIMHALIEFSLPPAYIKELELKLRNVLKSTVSNVEKISIAGPVEMRQYETETDDEKAVKGVIPFSIVSATLNNNNFSTKTVTSGFAPLYPGSKTAIAVNFDALSAQLMFKSFEMPVSDLSIGIQAYYVAAVRTYNATVNADAALVYQCFKKLVNNQSGYKRTQIKNVVDSLYKKAEIKVEILDRTKEFNVDSKELEAILTMFTNKIIEAFFDVKMGWLNDPERKIYNEEDQMPGRRSRGAFARFFAGTGNQEYVSDEQFSLKEEKIIKITRFYLNLSKTNSVRVPIYTTGNLTILNNLKNDTTYFQTIELNSPTFQKRDVYFQLDRFYFDCFKDKISNVTIDFKKNGSVKTYTLSGRDVETADGILKVNYNRLGDLSSNWLNYEYRIKWNTGGTGIYYPNNGPDDWLQANASSIVLTPPFVKIPVELNLDEGVVDSITHYRVTFLAGIIDSVAPQTIKKDHVYIKNTTLPVRFNLYVPRNNYLAYKIIPFYKSRELPEAQHFIIAENINDYIIPGNELKIFIEPKQ